MFPALAALLLSGAPVLVEAPVDAPLLARIRGQTSDLPWVLHVVEPPADLPGAPLSRARALAEAHAANIVMRLEPLDGGGVRVRIAQARQGRLLTRVLEAPDPDEHFGRSALMESVAVAVRASLRALAAGGDIGVAGPPPPPVAVEPSPPSPPVQPVESVTPVHASLGWQAAYDGHSSPAQHGLHAAVGLDGAGWTAGLAVASGLRSELSDERSVVGLARHTLCLFGGLHVADTSQVRVTAIGSAGVAAYRRSTTPLLPEVVASPAAWTVAAIAGVSARVSWFPPFSGRRLGLFVEGGADAVAGAPGLRYRDGEALVERNDLWTVQPRVGLGVVVTAN